MEMSKEKLRPLFIRFKLMALFEGLILGGAYIRREICVSESIGLAYSWKEIYVSNLQKVFTETRHADGDLSKTQPCKDFVNMA